MERLQNKIDNNLLSDIQQLIETSKSQVASTINSAMTLMYWHIGDRINREVLGGERAAYGKQIIENLAFKLTTEYGKGFDSKSLRRMMKFLGINDNYSEKDLESAHNLLNSSKL